MLLSRQETELEFEQFVIDVGPVAVDDLSRKLKDTRPLPNSVNLWKEIGFDPKYLEELSSTTSFYPRWISFTFR